MKFTLKIWRQSSPREKGGFETFPVQNIPPDASFLEMLDILNENLVRDGKEPAAFDHDCREGICGACGLLINGEPHGPKKAATVCQLYMREFQDGQKIVIEPFRAKAFPVIKDLIVDRSAFDRIQQAGGYVSVKTGAAPEANAVAVEKQKADEAFLAAACIGCGACVASCKNSSAALFVSARLSHFELLPQGRPEKDRRALNMTAQTDREGFGACSHTGSCSAACPKEISLENIARMNRAFLRASFKNRNN